MKLLTKMLVFVSFGLMISSLAFAHGPTPQKVDEVIEVNADMMTVWNVVKSFDSLAKWHPSVKSIVMTDPSTRVVTLKSGGVITDSLDELNVDEHYISYRLLEENVTAFPVSFYTITIQVLPEGKTSKISWSGRFYRADTGNFPPENLNDAAAVKAMEDYANAGLQGLATAVEK